MPFDAYMHLQRIKRYRAKKRKKLTQKKRIIKHANSILFLRENDASLSHIVTFLRRKKRIKISRTYLYHLLNNQLVVQPEPLSEESKKELIQYLNEIKNQQRKNRTKKFIKSKLDKYSSEIIDLRENGASYEDIRIWIWQQKHIETTSKNISQQIKRWLNSN